MKIRKDAKNALWDCMNDTKSPFTGVVCPICGATYSHYFVQQLGETDLGNRTDGVLIGFEFECGCIDQGIIIAEHKGECFMSKLLAQPWEDKEV